MDERIIKSHLGNVLIKLDLFHASARVNRVIRKSELSKDCKETLRNQIKLLFRSENDKKDIRFCATAEKEIVVKNIDNVISHWENNSHVSEIIRELKKLKKHALKGCLSEIPCSVSTSKNEALHKSINQFFSSRTTVSLQLFQALLHCFVICYNRRRDGSTKPLSCSIDPLICKKSDNLLDIGFGIGKCQSNEDFIVNNEDCELDYDLIAQNVKNLMSIASMVKPTSLEFDIEKCILLKTDIILEERFHESTMNSVLSDLSMALVTNLKTFKTFRKAFVANLCKSSDEYFLVQSFQTSDKSAISEKIRSCYSKKDPLQIKIQKISDFARTVTFIVCPKTERKVFIVLPKVIQNPIPVVIAIESDQFACVEVLDCSCCCGSGLKTKKPPCSGSRCPCRAKDILCKNQCKCSKLCKNSAKSNLSVEVNSVKSTTSQHSGKLKRKRVKEFYEANNIPVKTGPWLFQEKLLLNQILSFGIKSYFKITGHYNSVVQRYPELCLRKKRQCQVQAKVSDMR